MFCLLAFTAQCAPTADETTKTLLSLPTQAGLPTGTPQQAMHLGSASFTAGL